MIIDATTIARKADHLLTDWNADGVIIIVFDADGVSGINIGTAKKPSSAPTIDRVVEFALDAIGVDRY